MIHFKGLTFGQKISLALLSSTVLSLLIVGYFSFQYGVNSLTETTLAAGLEDIQTQSHQIETFIQGIRQDVLFLHGTPPVQGIFRSQANDNVDPHDGSTTGLWVKRFETISASLMREKPQYKQIAILDHNGTELSRVNRQGKTITRSGGHGGIHDLGVSLYFQNTLKLSLHQVNLSPVTLETNQESDTTSNRQPLFRVATPIFDEQGHTQGMVVITGFANSFLEWLPRTHEHGWQFYLVNESGSFLRHPDQTWEWGSDIDDRHSRTAHAQFGALTPQLLSGSVLQLNDSGEADLFMTAPIRANALDNAASWNLILAIPKESISAQMSSYKWTLLGVLVFSLLLGQIMSIILVRPLVRHVILAKKVLWNAAQGDLTGRFEETSEDELGKMSFAFNEFMGNLGLIIDKVKNVTEATTNKVKNLTGRTFEVSVGSEVQTDQATQVATTVEEMSATLKEMAKNSQHLATNAKEVETAAQHGGQVVAESIKGMQTLSVSIQESARRVSQLSAHSKEIGAIIGVIEEIADQTNLLALNAAIEAARAGEQGRGFAVVADEVRKLAERTGKSTKEISVVIQTVQQETTEAVAAMDAGSEEVTQGMRRVNEAGDELNNIVNGVLKVTEMVHQIAAAIEEQSKVTGEIVDNVQTVATLSQDNKRDVDEVNAIAQQIATQAHDLQETVGQFIVHKREAEVTLF